MPDDTKPAELDRRSFLQAGATAAAAGAAINAIPAVARGQQDPAADDKPAAEKAATVLPTRKLGRTGADVTILNLGTWRAPGSLPRLLRSAYANGVRYFDTAKSYGSEPAFKAWFEQSPEVRKDIFLVTKDVPQNSPMEMVDKVAERCEALGVDQLDLIFIHALGDHNYEKEHSWIDSPEFKAAAEAIRKSGKARFVGFTTHHKDRAALLATAAKSGYADAIMLQYSPWIEPDSDLNKAIDACYKAGIGLISMKQLGGQEVDETFKRVPVLKERGLNPYQGLLQASWTDDRLATACVAMKTLDQIKENVHAARTFEPLKKADLDDIRGAALLAGRTLCSDCDGRCSRAAGTTAELGNLTRYLTYFEHHGYRTEARRQFQAMDPAARDWTGADLAAATEACPQKLNFAQLMPRIDKQLS
jgi:aryl-alcohol dehydrogenase-like predicted oxidoreductase